jgi:hypothetical protein
MKPATKRGSKGERERLPIESVESLIATIAANATPRLPRREGVRLWKHRLLPEGRKH